MQLSRSVPAASGQLSRVGPSPRCLQFLAAPNSRRGWRSRDWPQPKRDALKAQAKKAAEPEPAPEIPKEFFGRECVGERGWRSRLGWGREP